MRGAKYNLTEESILLIQIRNELVSQNLIWYLFQTWNNMNCISRPIQIKFKQFCYLKSNYLKKSILRSGKQKNNES